jgi:hypothetical protein
MQIGVVSVGLTGFSASYQVAIEISDVNFLDGKKGTFEITVKVRQRHLVGTPEGNPPDDLGKDWLLRPEGAPTFNVRLEPVPGKSKYLRGIHRYKPGEGIHQAATEDWKYLD